MNNHRLNFDMLEADGHVGVESDFVTTTLQRRWLPVAVLTILLCGLIVIAGVIWGRATMAEVGALVGPIVFAFCMGVMVYAAFVQMDVEHRRHDVIKLFIKENQFQLIENAVEPGYPGVIFNQGHDESIRIGFWLTQSDGRHLEMGNFGYVEGHGRQSTTYEYGYVGIELARHLPHILLDAKENNIMGSNLPVWFQSNQRADLEGDFGKHFTLYAPEGYQTDLRYVLTPNIMTLLMDKARAYDLEIIDNILFIYKKGRFRFESKNQMNALFSLVEQISKELNEQVDYYSDERIDNRALDTVAEEGRRLKMRGLIPIGALALFVLSCLVALDIVPVVIMVGMMTVGFVVLFVVSIKIIVRNVGKHGNRDRS